MDLSRLVMRDGTATSASGQVIAYEGRTWFGPIPQVVPAVYYEPGSEPPPRPSTVSVPVEGVDLSQLHERWEKDGGTQGFATLSGIWRDGVLAVTEQGPPGYPDSRDEIPQWKIPPCDPPAGGWPTGRRIEYGQGVELDGDEVVQIVIFRPHRRSEIVVIASEDPVVTRDRLASLGSHLCVVQSRWTRAEVEAVRGELFAHADWTVHTFYVGAGEDAQANITAEAVLIVGSFAAYVATVPDDLLSVSAWLVPSG